MGDITTRLQRGNPAFAKAVCQPRKRRDPMRSERFSVPHSWSRFPRAYRLPPHTLPLLRGRRVAVRRVLAQIGYGMGLIDRAMHGATTERIANRGRYG